MSVSDCIQPAPPPPHLRTMLQLQDRQHALTSSIEDLVSAQLASARAAGAALKTELTSKVRALPCLCCFS